MTPRAGYTATIFLVDLSPSMGTTRTLDLPPGPNGEPRTKQVTHLQWSLQFAMLKIQEMIFNGRKTDQCGVILFGTEETDNVVNRKDGGYDHITEFIRIAQPNADTLAKLATLEATDVAGDPIDAIVVGSETLHQYLATKRTWTGKLVLLTDGESPIEVEKWELIAKKVKDFNRQLTIVGVDFDDDEIDFHEEGKSHIKRENEIFFNKFTAAIPNSVMGTLSFALQEVTKPEVKQTRSALIATTLRLGDPDNNPLEAFEIVVKTSKCTALTRPTSWKRFAPRVCKPTDAMDVDLAPSRDEEGLVDSQKMVWAQLKMRTEFHVEQEDEDEGNEDVVDADSLKKRGAKVEKEQLVRGFKYGSSYVPCPDGQFARLSTHKGISICGFFNADNFRREHSMGEVQYVWANPDSPQQQVALSSLVKAMDRLNMYAIARWVTRDMSDAKMGVLAPCRFQKVDCLLWVQMPFADDVRKYTFLPLQNLTNRKGEKVATHPYLPTYEQMEAMDRFVDAMDLMEAGEKDDDGNQSPWFDTRISYNPAIHRMKQALFHSAVTQDLVADPLPQPHVELTKYFEPPKTVLTRAEAAVDNCRTSFAIKKVPKRVARPRKNDHARAQDDDDETLLLDRVAPSNHPQSRLHSQPEASGSRSQSQTSPAVVKPVIPRRDDNSATDPESDEDVWLPSRKKGAKLPTPSPEPGIATDPQRAPGRIIGMATPLADFKHNISQGDVVSKAVEDLGWAVKEVVLRPFAGRRHAEMITCLEELREVCLQEDEIDAWNSILRELKMECAKEPGNPAFWGEIKKRKGDLGLITASEAARYGGKSNILDASMEEFWAI